MIFAGSEAEFVGGLKEHDAAGFQCLENPAHAQLPILDVFENVGGDDDVIDRIAHLVVLQISKFDIGFHAERAAPFAGILDQLRADLQALALQAAHFAHDGEPTCAHAHFQDAHGAVDFLERLNRFQVALVLRFIILERIARVILNEPRNFRDFFLVNFHSSAGVRFIGGLKGCD